MSACPQRERGGIFVEETGTRPRLIQQIAITMNHLLALRAAALAGLVFAAPATGFTKDKHHDDHHDDHHSSSAHTVYVQPYCAPSFGHGFHSYGYAPYYSRPSVSVGFYSTPAYYGTSYYGTPDYDYDSYPARTVYRGIPRTNYRYSYRDSSSYNDDLAVDVQRALARRGYYRGGIDGDVGPGTRAAIRSYQYHHHLEVTGRIDRTLLRSLGLS